MKNHPLYRLGARLVQVAHMSESDLMGAASRCWVSQLTAAMNGELNSGIGAQVQSMSLNAMSAGVGALKDIWSNEQGKMRMRELTLQGRLTSDEREELATLRGAEYARLDRSYREDPTSLSAKDRMKHRRYADADRAARVTEHWARQQSKVDAQRDAGPNRKESDAKQARKHRDPEPLLTTGTRPATASSKPPVGVDSMGAIHRLREQGRVVADSRAHLKQTLTQPSVLDKSAKSHGSATDLLIPPVVGSIGTLPMSGFNPAMAVPALGNPVTAAGAAGLAGAFIDILAGKEVQLNEAVSESHGEHPNGGL